MQAGPTKLLEKVFVNNKLIEIPFYQRSYVWGEDEWSRLLEDLLNMCEHHEDYFLGSLIFKDTVYVGLSDMNWSAKYVVVDGQQRLTTILILLKVLALKTSDNATFHDFFFENDRLRGLQEFRVKHNRVNGPDFNRVMNLDSLEDLPNDSRILAAYNYFRENIGTEAIATLEGVRNVCLGMSFILITTYDGENEQQIFDTINSLGVRLTTAELLKNYFFNESDPSKYETYWRSIFERDKEALVYWDMDIVTGRIRRTLIDLFFDAFLQITIENKKYRISEATKKTYQRIDRLFISYRDFVDHYLDDDKDALLGEIRNYANLFRQTFNPAYCDECVGPSPGIDRMNVVIFGLKNSTLIPYVLYLVKNVPDKATLDEMLHILESYIMRRILSRASTKNYNRFFSTLIREEILDPESLAWHLSENDDGTTALPGLKEIAVRFNSESQLTHLQSRGILYLLESALRPEGMATNLLGFNSYSLEHLMPQKWKANWQRLNDEHLEAERDVKLKTLGNLAIIPQRLNGSIKNAVWHAKKTGLNGKPGLNTCAAGLVTMEDPLKQDEWDETSIAERAASLSSAATELWDF